MADVAENKSFRFPTTCSQPLSPYTFDFNLFYVTGIYLSVHDPGATRTWARSRRAEERAATETPTAPRSA